MSSGENELIAGRYRVTRQLGRGGMGVVWRAVDEVLGREVALKELRTYTDSSGHELADLRLRMQREARAAARVRHPGVISVHDVTDHQGRPVIVMEFIDGPSLDDVLGERGVMDPREAAAIGAKVLEALDAAHAVGVLHRDVKPGNVLLDRGGRVVLTDFGIAAMDDPGDGSTTHLTRSGEIVGSLDYLAPERAQGQEPGPASDIWALGATLYAAVEGTSPFRRTSTWSTLTAIVADPLPEPRRAGALGPVLRQLMDKDPARRPDAASAARLLAAVAEGREPGPASAAPGYVPTERTALPHQPQGFGPAAPAASGAPAAPTAPAAPAAPPVHTAPGARAGRRKSRARVLVAVAAVAVLLAGGGVTYAFMDGDKAPAGQELAGGQADRSGSPEPGRPLIPAPSATQATPAAKPSASEPAPEKSSAAADKPRASAPAAGGGTDGGATAGTGGASGTTGSGSGPGSSSGSGSGSGSTGGGSGTGGGSATTTGGGGEPAPVCHSIGGGKYNCQVWRTAKSYRADGSEAGVLNAGTNYFYCQANLGRRETHGEWTNVWWARTDDDSGNTGVYVSDVYIQGGDNDQPVPGLPVC
ncbi:serine/threonine protein phosphatase [Streptomyces sp. CB03234]|uniref:serine/threonine-protein kinase n=1 Tax=Streptomyces sp. (strain CB03234) TaxID=1703937 RepID=UPI00093D7092|nr:serine/threonine-protein kinase [Streptomyces sp. CB03234]OKK03400.1 serine/threonine protein phosphatase [Streptomyces sp. CB03234]